MFRSSNTKSLGFLISFTGAILFATKAIIIKKAFMTTRTDALTLLMLRMLFSLPFYVAAAMLTIGWKTSAAN